MHALRVVVACVAVGSIGISAALAQPTGGGGGAAGGQPAGRGGGEGGRGGGAGQGQPRGLAPEKAKAAWEMQAVGVAKHLGLSEAETTALVKAYTDARASHDAAGEKLRKELQEKRQQGGGGGDEGGGGGGGRRGGGMGAEALKAAEDLNTAEREKLQKALSASLNADQTAKAMASLGVFNRQWDMMVDTVAGFNLEGAKKQDALNAMEAFVVEQGKMRARLREAAGGGDGAGGGGGGGGGGEIRTAMEDTRKKLTDSMKKILSEEQFTKFEESMRAGGRGMGMGGGAGRRGGGEGGEGGGEGGGQPPRRGRGGGGGG